MYKEKDKYCVNSDIHGEDAKLKGKVLEIRD